MALQVANQDVESFYRFCLERPQGVTQADLGAAGWTDPQAVMTAANMLLGQGRLSLTQIAPGQLVYQAIDPNTAAKFNGLEREHLLVYQMIEKAGDKGAWSKVLKDQTNLQQHTLSKVTKELLRRQLIKEVKSVAHRGRKVFMLWDTEPDKSVSGGTWYRDGEFASAWIDSLREMAQAFLETNSGRVVTLDDLHMYIQQQPGPSAPTIEDVQAIMRTLELDELVYTIQSDNGQTVYSQRTRGPTGLSFDLFAGRLPSWALQGLRDESPADGLVVPCVLCPLQGECHPGGRICPEKCEYIASWIRSHGAAQAEPAGGGAGGRAPQPLQNDMVNDW